MLDQEKNQPLRSLQYLRLYKESKAHFLKALETFWAHKAIINWAVSKN